MKCKKFYSILATLAIVCSQAVVPAFATETTINGDWIDTSSMTPVYSAENLAAGTIETNVSVTDFIIDFEVEMNGRYMIKRDIGGTVKNWIDIRQNWATDPRDGTTVQGTGRHVQQVVNANGWFDFNDADADYPLYTTQNIGFRVQTKDGTISLWAADLDAEGGPVYKYAGYYTHDNAKNKEGTVQLWCGTAQTVKSVKVYNLSSSAIVDITGANAAKLVLSDAPSQELAAGDITLTDSFGKVIAATGIEKVSDTEYALAFAESLKAGVIYSADVDAVNAIGGGYLENSDYYMDAALNLDFNDESWKDYVGVYASGNINNTPTNALWKNDQIEVQETYSVITNDTYESNSIIEFDGMITAANNAAANKAKLQLNKNAEQYSEGVAKNYNSIWIYDHDEGKNPQYFLRKNADWVLANKIFDREATVKRGTMYSFRVVTEGTKLSLYMKEAASSSDYALVGTYSNDSMLTNDGRIEFGANNTGSYNGAIYDNIRVYETDSVATAEMKNNVITVNYSVEPATVLTAENVQVTKSDDSAAIISSVTRTGVATYEIALGSVVEGETYTVISTVKNICGADLKEAEVQAPEQEKLDYTLTPGTERTTAVITGAATAPDATVIFAVYEGAGLENVTVKNMSEIDAETNSFTFGGVAEGQTCALYVWDSLAGMNPLVK